MPRSLTLAVLAAAIAAGCSGDRKNQSAVPSGGSLTLKARGAAAPPPPPRPTK